MIPITRQRRSIPLYNINENVFCREYQFVLKAPKVNRQNIKMKVFTITLLALLVIARTSVETTEDVTSVLDFSGFDTALDSVNVDIAYLKGLVDTAGTTINGASSGVVNQVTEAVKSLRTAQNQLTGQLAAFAGRIVTSIAKIVDHLIETLEKSGSGGIEFGLTQLKNLQNVVQTIIEYANTATGQTQVDAATAALNNVADAMDKQNGTFSNAVIQLVSHVANVASPVVEVLGNTTADINSGNTYSIGKGATSSVGSLSNIVEEIPAALATALKSASTTIVSTLTETVTTAQDAVTTLV